MKTLLTVTTLAAFTSSTFAKGKPDPKLPKEIQAMYCLVFEWKEPERHVGDRRQERTSST